MAYWIGAFVGAALFVILITRLFMWIAGYLAQGRARIGIAYAMVVMAFLGLLFIGGQSTIFHWLLLPIAAGFDLWRDMRAVAKAKPFGTQRLNFD